MGLGHMGKCETKLSITSKAIESVCKKLKFDGIE
jgi:hypothetical protein